MTSKKRIRESLIIPDKNKEIPIWDLEFRKDKSILVLKCPKKGFHFHYYYDKESKRLKGHIKNEITQEKHQKIDLSPNELFEIIASHKIKTFT